MAKDVRFLIGANVDRAEQEIRKLQRTGEDVGDRLGRAFETLGTKSSMAIDRQKDSINRAYESIKNSGVASADEITRAEKARADKIVQIDEEHFGKRSSLLESFKQNWMAVTAAIAGAWFAVTQAWNLAGEAAKGLQQRASFSNLAASHGVASSQIIADLKRSSAETIATRDLIEKAGTAMLLGIPADKLSKLMEIARASARVTGQSMTKSFEDISLGVARQSRLIMDNLGIIIQEEKANKTYAAALGKTAEQLTDAEKRQAFMNATLEAGDEMIKRVGITGMSTAEKMQRLEARMKDLKEVVGVGLLAVLNVVSGALNLAASGALYLSGALFKVGQGVAWLTGNKDAMAEWKINADAAFGAAKDLGKKGLGDLSTAMDLATGKIGPLNANTKKMEEAAKAAAEAEQKRKEYLKASAEAVGNYAKSVSELGKAQLKLAENGFSRDLQRQEEYFKKNQSLAANLAAPLRNYLGVLDTVYGAQLKAHRDIEDVLKKIGAEKKIQLSAQLSALQVEKTYSEASLKAWGDYLGSLKTMYATAIDDIKKKQVELTELQKYGADNRKALQDKYFPTPPQLDPYVKFYDDLNAADASMSSAMQLTGDKRIEAIKKTIDLLKTMPEEVSSGDDVLISRQEIYEKITSRANEWQKEAEAAKQAQIDTAKTAAQVLAQEMSRAEEAMAALETKIVNLDGKIVSLSRTVTLTLNDQVTGGVANIQFAIDGLKSGRSVAASYVSSIPGRSSSSSPSEYYESNGSMYWGDGSYAGPSLAVGTNRVPADGFAFLHKDEAVVPAKYNPAAGGTSPGSGAAVTITGNIILPNVTNQTTARELFAEFQKLGRMAA